MPGANATTTTKDKHSALNPLSRRPRGLSEADGPRQIPFAHLMKPAWAGAFRSQEGEINV